LSEYAIILSRLAQYWGERQKRNLAQGYLWGEDDARTSNTHMACACTEKVRDTTLDNENTTGLT